MLRSNSDDEDYVKETKDANMTVESVVDDDNNNVDSCDSVHNSSGCLEEDCFDLPPFSSESESEVTPDPSSLLDELGGWATKHRLSRESVNNLLLILRNNGIDVPKDSRTLVKTPKYVQEVTNKCGGMYCYIGVEKGVKQAVEYLPEFDEIRLSINIDGLSLSKSSNSQLWPILGSINNSQYVFPTALFNSTTKPDYVTEYLDDFISEIKKLIANGVSIGNKTYKFILKSFICDAPARSFLKCMLVILENTHARGVML